ncbi:MAG: Hsp20/alpha crystallin family protein [Bacteroidales bacterium]|nr:Hsp20/alpha crystallin family protein [Bacteroidales bacterium]
MALIHYKSPELNHSNGYNGYKTFSELVNSLFNNNNHDCRTCRPAANIYESSTGYRIELAIPGLEKNQVKISIDNDLLVLKHESSREKKSNNVYTRHEFSYVDFERSFIIPENVDSEKISANYHNGLLIVKLPLKEDQVKKGPKEIDIK